mmetsp:Transcript_5080/g.20218  ORF Transcript_5080/g.20218 Transcript_5080/m.20218 type:complete len:215 (+) Transcript_5080:1589-2233(+)
MASACEPGSTLPRPSMTSATRHQSTRPAASSGVSRPNALRTYLTFRAGSREASTDGPVRGTLRSCASVCAAFARVLAFSSSSGRPRCASAHAGASSSSERSISSSKAGAIGAPWKSLSDSSRPSADSSRSHPFGMRPASSSRRASEHSLRAMASSTSARVSGLIVERWSASWPARSTHSASPVSSSDTNTPATRCGGSSASHWPRPAASSRSYA